MNQKGKNNCRSQKKYLSLITRAIWLKSIRIESIINLHCMPNG